MLSVTSSSLFLQARSPFEWDGEKGIKQRQPKYYVYIELHIMLYREGMEGGKAFYKYLIIALGLFRHVSLKSINTINSINTNHTSRIHYVAVVPAGHSPGSKILDGIQTVDEEQTKLTHCFPLSVPLNLWELVRL